MRRSFIMVCLLACSVCAASQSTATAAVSAKQASGIQSLPADAATREDILKLFDVLNMRKMMDIAFEVGKQQGTALAEQMWRDSFPKQTEEEKQAFDKMMRGLLEDVKSSFPADELLNAVVPIYQRHFTRADINAIVDFYQSPAGRKFVQEQPQMMQESAEVMTPIQQKMMHDLMTKIQARVQNEIESQRKKSQSQTLKQ